MRTLTIALAAFVFMVAMCPTNVKAAVQTTVPLIVTESVDPAGVYCYINVSKKSDATVDPGKPIAAWSSLSGDQFIYFPGLNNELGLTLPGVGQDIKKFFVSIDRKTFYEIVQVPGKGYILPSLPELTVGEMRALEVFLRVDDKHMSLLKIIHWTNNRNLSTAIHIMPQVPPANIDKLTAKECFRRLNLNPGFIPADPAFLAK